MKQLKSLLFVSIIAASLVGCGSDSEPPNPAGAEAKSDKKYSKEDAAAAQPVRGDALKDSTK
jgi:hypothetical protein